MPEDKDQLLARIDERTQVLQTSMERVEHLLEHKYVTQDEFKPIKSIVYGMISTVLLAVLGALIALVVRK